MAEGDIVIRGTPDFASVRRELDAIEAQINRINQIRITGAVGPGQPGTAPGTFSTEGRPGFVSRPAGPSFGSSFSPAVPNITEQQLPLYRHPAQVPPLQEGMARAIHLTSTPPEAFARGFDYGKYGMLSSTARTFSQNPTPEQYRIRDDPRFSSARYGVIMDIPQEDVRRHESVTSAPGRIPASQIRGFVEFGPEAELRQTGRGWRSPSGRWAAGPSEPGSVSLSSALPPPPPMTEAQAANLAAARSAVDPGVFQLPFQAAKVSVAERRRAADVLQIIRRGEEIRPTPEGAALVREYEAKLGDAPSVAQARHVAEQARQRGGGYAQADMLETLGTQIPGPGGVALRTGALRVRASADVRVSKAYERAAGEYERHPTMESAYGDLTPNVLPGDSPGRGRRSGGGADVSGVTPGIGRVAEQLVDDFVQNLKTEGAKRKGELATAAKDLAAANAREARFTNALDRANLADQLGAERAAASFDRRDEAAMFRREQQQRAYLEGFSNRQIEQEQRIQGLDPAAISRIRGYNPPYDPYMSIMERRADRPDGPRGPNGPRFPPTDDPNRAFGENWARQPGGPNARPGMMERVRRTMTRSVMPTGMYYGLLFGAGEVMSTSATLQAAQSPYLNPDEQVTQIRAGIQSRYTGFGLGTIARSLSEVTGLMGAGTSGTNWFGRIMGAQPGKNQGFSSWSDFDAEMEYAVQQGEASKATVLAHQNRNAARVKAGLDDNGRQPMGHLRMGGFQANIAEQQATGNDTGATWIQIQQSLETEIRNIRAYGDELSRLGVGHKEVERYTLQAADNAKRIAEAQRQLVIKQENMAQWGLQDQIDAANMRAAGQFGAADEAQRRFANFAQKQNANPALHGLIDQLFGAQENELGARSRRRIQQMEGESNALWQEMGGFGKEAAIERLYNESGAVRDAQGNIVDFEGLEDSKNRGQEIHDRSALLRQRAAQIEQQYDQATEAQSKGLASDAHITSLLAKGAEGSARAAEILEETNARAEGRRQQGGPNTDEDVQQILQAGMNRLMTFEREERLKGTQGSAIEVAPGSIGPGFSSDRPREEKSPAILEAIRVALEQLSAALQQP